MKKRGGVCNIGYGLLAGICESRDAILDNLFEKTMLTLPEYKNVVNRELIKSASIQNSIIDKTSTPPETKSLKVNKVDVKPTQTKEIMVATTSLTETNLDYIEHTTESKKPWFSKVVSWFDFRKFFSK